MKKALILSVTCNLILVSFFIGKRIYYSYGFAKPPQPDWLAIAEEKNKEKIAEFNNYPIDSNDIVFIGNSLAEGFPAHEFYSNVKNRAIGGNTIDHLMGRIDQITNGRPKKLFIEIGINDINLHIGLDTIEAKFEALILKIRKQSPVTKIYIQSLLPTNGEYANVLPVISKFNFFLKELSQHYGITYIDLYTAMLKDGRLDSSLTRDGLHLNIIGYEIWKEQVDKFVMVN